MGELVNFIVDRKFFVCYVIVSAAALSLVIRFAALCIVIFYFHIYD